MADFNEAEKKQFQKLNERIEKENKEKKLKNALHR